MTGTFPDFSALSIAAIAEMADRTERLPVERWNPQRCGDSDMRITADGRWFHEGGEITRPTMVRLFARLLRREGDGRHVLVTPVEKLDIAVDDAPFVAVEMTAEGIGRSAQIAFLTNVGDTVVAGPDHPIALRRRDGGLRPYVHVRAGLEALIARPVYYALAERALDAGDTPPGLWSGGAFFAFGGE